MKWSSVASKTRTLDFRHHQLYFCFIRPTIAESFLFVKSKAAVVGLAIFNWTASHRRLFLLLVKSDTRTCFRTFEKSYWAKWSFGVIRMDFGIWLVVLSCTLRYITGFLWIGSKKKQLPRNRSNDYNNTSSLFSTLISNFRSKTNLFFAIHTIAKENFDLLYIFKTFYDFRLWL